VLDPKTHQLQCEEIAVGGFLGKALRSWWIFIRRDRIDVSELRSTLKNTGIERILVIFQDKPLCSAISFKRSRQQLSIDVAEHRSMLKAHKNGCYY